MDASNALHLEHLFCNLYSCIRFSDGNKVLTYESVNMYYFFNPVTCRSFLQNLRSSNLQSYYQLLISIGTTSCFSSELSIFFSFFFFFATFPSGLLSGLRQPLSFCSKALISSFATRGC